MPNPGPFSKATKKCIDLLVKKNYEQDRKVTLKTKTANGVTFTAETVTAKNKKTSAEQVTGKVGAKFNLGNGFSLDKFEISSAHKFTTEASLKGALDNTKLTLKCVLVDFNQPATGEVSELGAEVTGDNYTFNAVLDPLKYFTSSKFIHISGLVAPTNNFIVGGEFSFAGAAATTKSADQSEMLSVTEKFTDLGFVLGYKQQDYSAIFQASGMHTGESRNLTFNVHHQYKKNIEIGSLTKYTIGKKAVDVTFGGKMKSAGGGTYAAKVNSTSNNVSLSYTTLIQPGAELSTSAVLPLTFLDKASIGAKFGFALNLGAI